MRRFGGRGLQRFQRVSLWVLALGIAALAAQAQQVAFSPALNVSNDAGNSQVPQIAVDGRGNINVVWRDNSPGNSSVFFSRSSDGGATFSAPVNLSNNPGGSALFPQIAVDSSGNIYVVWFDSNSGSPSIFFRRSTDDGTTFSPSFSGPAVRWPIFLGVDRSSGIYLLWAANDSSGVPQVVFSRSNDGGATFSNLTISNSATGVNTSSVGSSTPGYLALDSNGNINVVWTESASPQGPNLILFSRSTDNGASFSVPARVTGSAGTLFGVNALDVDGSGNIHVLWTASNAGVENTFLSRSSDGGTTFAAENFQSGPSDSFPFGAMAVDSQGGINVVWNSGGQNPVLHFARSADEGATFTTQTLEGDNFANPGPASVVTDAGGDIDIVWTQGGGPGVPGGVIFTRSTDSGKTFSPHQQIAGMGAQNLTAAVDSAGNIYTVWSQVVSTGNGDIFFDRGAAPAPPVISLASLSLSSPSLTGGNSATSSVTLSGAASVGGTTISLASSNPAVASVPPSVTVPAGGTSASFNVVTTAVSTPASITISASFNGVTQTATLTVLPPILAVLALNPSSATGGSSSTGTIALSGPAPSEGVVVALSSSNPAVARVPANVTVPAGSTNARFTMDTRAVPCLLNQVTISAAFSGVRLTTLKGLDCTRMVQSRAPLRHRPSFQ